MAITITGVSSMTGVSSITFAGGAIATDLTFPTVTNWQESPAHRWGPITGNNGEGRTNKSLAASTDGWIQQEVNISANARLTGICLHSTNGNGSPFYGSADYNLYVDTDNHYWTSVVSVFHDSGVTAVDGDLCRLNRVSGTITAEYYRGGVWTVMYTFSATTTAQLWAMASSADIGVPVFCLNPKGYNIT